MDKEALDEYMKSPEWIAFYNSRPLKIRKLIDQFAPGEYIIKQGAPYGLSCPGTRVEIISYREDGMVGVVIRAKDKLPQCIKNEQKIGELHNLPQDKILRQNLSDVMVHVDSKWLEPIKM